MTLMFSNFCPTSLPVEAFLVLVQVMDMPLVFCLYSPSFSPDKIDNECLYKPKSCNVYFITNQSDLQEEPIK
jgi:hypothetical protein